MGIRDTSYYGWKNVDLHFEPISGSATFSSSSFSSMAINSSGTVYAGGTNVQNSLNSWILKENKKGSDVWSTLFFSSTLNRGTSGIVAVGVDSNDKIFLVGDEGGGNLIIKSSSDKGDSWGQYKHPVAQNSLVSNISLKGDIAIFSNNVYIVGQGPAIFSSTDGGLSWGYQNVFSEPDSPLASGIHINNNGVVFACGGGGGQPLMVVTSSNNGVTWKDITPSNTAMAEYFMDIVTDSLGNIYVSTGESVGNSWFVLSSSDGGSTWGSSSVGLSYTGGDGSKGNYGYFVGVDSGDSVYSFGFSGSRFNEIRPIWYASRRPGFSGSWSKGIDMFTTIGALGGAFGGFIDNDDDLYAFGMINGKDAVVRKGKLTANSASIGPRMLNTSFGYVHEEFSGSTIEKFKLNNISEFPHSSGLFQMKNVVLGTVGSGKIGRAEDSIIRVSHFGSVVHVMWPRQEDMDVPIAGFGDFSVGERAGKLTTEFQPGSPVDVTKFDHMALYCGLVKQASGTLDDIIITLERKPLRGAGFGVEQTVEYATSGSKTEARLRDLEYKKEINYGDLSIKEIAFPIDVPLTNVKEVRVQARHKNGQEEPNRNLIIWGRFVKSTEET